MLAVAQSRQHHAESINAYYSGKDLYECLTGWKTVGLLGRRECEYAYYSKVDAPDGMDGAPPAAPDVYFDESA